MSLDKIVVLVMAIAFFGGLAFVYWKGRQAELKSEQKSSTAASESVEDVSPGKSQEKGRKSSKH